jgi:hypothetical protein
MKKTMIILAVLMFSCVGMMAQVKVGKYKDWKKTIDLLEVKAPYDFTGRKTVILLPVETSAVKLPDKDNDNYKLVTKSLANLTQSLANELQKNLQKQGYKVIVAENADVRDPEAIVLQLNWTEFDLGNRALRAWVGFGAGNAGFGTDGVIYDGDDAVITFSHRRISPMDSRDYEKLAVKGVKDVCEDLAKMILGL